MFAVRIVLFHVVLQARRYMCAVNSFWVVFLEMKTVSERMEFYLLGACKFDYDCLSLCLY